MSKTARKTIFCQGGSMDGKPIPDEGLPYIKIPVLSRAFHFIGSPNEYGEEVYQRRIDATTLEERYVLMDDRIA